MTKIHQLACCILLGLFSLNLFAAGEGKKNGGGLIWHVEKNGQHSYYLGSVHFANRSFYPLAPAVLDAYNESKVLVVEVDDQLVSPEEQQRLMLQHGLYPNGETLHDHLSPETIQQIRRLLNEFQVPLHQVDSYRPGMLTMTLTMLQASKLGFNAEQGIDRYFLQKARHKKTIRQIEDFAFQMSLLGKLPEDEKSLQSSFENMSDYKDHWYGTMRAWKAGDAEALYELAIGKPLAEYPELYSFFDVLFFSRHEKMASVANDCAQNKEVCFIVIGAGHLLGDQGVLAELRKQGYAVTQL